MIPPTFILSVSAISVLVKISSKNQRGLQFEIDNKGNIP